MKPDINAVCKKVNSCNGDADLLKEVFDYIDYNKSLYPKHEIIFIKEYINKAIKHDQIFIELINTP